MSSSPSFPFYDIGCKIHSEKRGRYWAAVVGVGDSRFCYWVTQKRERI